MREEGIVLQWTEAMSLLDAAHFVVFDIVSENMVSRITVLSFEWKADRKVK